MTRRTKRGGEVWYGKWYGDDGQVMRSLGPKRAPGSSKGLTRKQAEAELRKRMEAQERPISERVTVGEAGRRLVSELKAKGRKPSTIEAVESSARVHLGPHFAGRSLESVKPEHVEGFMSAKAGEGRAPKSIANYVGTLHSIFELAIRRGWAESNPCKRAATPARSRPSSDIRFLDEAELEALVRAEAENTDPLAPTLSRLYLVAAMTGLRQGELLGLRWRDVDWPAARIRVRTAWVRGETTTPKSGRGRSVPMADRVAGELDLHSKASDYTRDGDLVFPHPELGRPLDRSMIRKRFKASVTRAGVGRFKEVEMNGKRESVPLTRFHDLRHTFGTRTAGAGVPMRTIQEWLGHVDIQTTMIYADYSPSHREAEWIAAAFAPPAVNPVPTEQVAN